MYIRSIKAARYILILFAMTLSLQAASWGLTGHRVIGEIASTHLSKKAKKEIRKLFGEETLAWWANWSDFIRSDSNWNHSSPWHYVNIKSGLSKEDFLTALKAIPGKSLYTQITEMSNQAKDKTLPLEQRQVALKFLIHLIGDLHQPLHVGHAEDLGGNRITVYWFDEKTNLHTLWDSKLVDFQQFSYTEYARLLNHASKEDIAQWQSTSLEDIFYETYKLAEQVYDSAKPDEKLSYRYVYRFKALMEQQFLKGGVRLAAWLNKTFE